MFGATESLLKTILFNYRMKPEYMRFSDATDVIVTTHRYVGGILSENKDRVKTQEI